MNVFKISLLAMVVVSFNVLANEKGLDVIYGEDNRKDVFESRDSKLVELSRSTAAMISPNVLKAGRSGEVIINSKTLEGRGICAQERFSNQISAANCSGFLVAPNVLVTAGHCIKSAFDCSSYKWVFDFKVDYPGQSSITVPSSSVYSCKKIIEQSLDNSTKNDYAVIELDRAVTDRKPLAFRRKGKVKQDYPIAVIGHPTGLPTKITDEAKVRSYKDLYFVANLDTYGGNSGSAVFNTRTYLVEGILVRGENDYVYDSRLGCQVSNVCPEDGCRGEDVTYITNISALKNIR